MPLEETPTIPADYMERVYAGWLGKVIGVRHGGNVEGWSYEQIERTFGELNGYVHSFKNFAADDDTNGPMFFLRALEDYTHTRGITAEQMGKTLLNYAPDGHGFFWWGGYGKSTEHTAYLNLQRGLAAPRSGSIEQNGEAIAEQIGGQIFIDVWGLIAPGRPSLAAEYAAKMASVTHDGNGIYGGMFIAACIAAAFTESDVERIIEAGLSVIPADCEYARMARAVMAFHGKAPGNWRDCFAYVRDNFGYDRYPGVCHIIPNSAVIVLSLLYSGGDFSKAVNICNMCGWDTDCNVGNVGTIMGVRGGLAAIDRAWITPINDFLCCSSVIGTLNIVDLPWCAAYIAKFGYLIAGAEPPAKWKPVVEGDAPRFHFELPGSTHAFRTAWDASGSYVTARIENTGEAAATGTRSLKVLFDHASGGHGYRVYHQTYYKPNDFNDSRYDPCFSPLLYPGQTVTGSVMVPQSQPAGIGVQARLYVKDRNAVAMHYGPQRRLAPGEWTGLRFNIPAMADVCIEEAGVEFIPDGGYAANLIAYVDHMDFSGKPDYTIDFKQERMERWNGLHQEVSQCTYLRGVWSLEDGELSGSYAGASAECYTGDLSWRDYRMTAVVVPKLGEHHCVQFRVQGAIRSYAVGLAPGGRIALYKNDGTYTELASAEFPWHHGSEYRITATAVGSRYEISANGRTLISYEDKDNPHAFGQIGFCNFDGSHTHYRSFGVTGL